MSLYKLESGQSIQLTTNSVFYKDVYQSSILSITDNRLEISSPIYKGVYVPINIGLILNLKVHTPQGICEFATEVIDRNIDAHSLLIGLPADRSQIEIIQNTISNICRFITVTSGKGGVGKTSFIINYALGLIKRGKKVVLMDADLGMANIDVLLKLTPKYNLIDVIDGSKTLQEIIVAAPGGVKLIPGGSGIQDLAYLTEEQIARITVGFYYLSKNFDYVLIDTGAGLSKNITNFIFASDETIIVTIPEPHAITDAYSIIKVILSISSDVNLKLVVNKCETLVEGQSILNKMTKVVKNFLDFDIVPIGCILESKVVSRAIKEQTPFYITYAKSEATRAIDVIVNSELGEEMTKEVPEILNSIRSNSFITKFKSFFGR